MATSPTATHASSGLLLLADISGYTEFLGRVATEHPEMIRPGGPVPPAFAVMSGMLNCVVERLAPTFELAEIEGDAVFAYALDEPLRLAEVGELIAVVESAHAGFRERIDEAMVALRHECNACFLLPSLELKFVVHHGDFVIQPIAGQARLIGPAVIVAHRLLKNSVTERTGLRAYLLLTDAAAAHLHVDPTGGLAHAEEYPDIGVVPAQVIRINR